MSPNRVEPLAKCVVKFVTLDEMIKVSAVKSPLILTSPTTSRATSGLVVPMPTLAAEPSKKTKVLPFPSAILKSLN